MLSRRALVSLAALGATLALIANLGFDATPDLRPVMPEADGVHPVRAAEALRLAYAPGQGFPDKYPPLGSSVFGLAVLAVDPAFAHDTSTVKSLPEDERRVVLWGLADRIAVALVAERWVSRLAACACAAVLALLAAATAQRAGARAGEAALAGALAALALGCSYPLLYYGSTTNVDALALLASLLAVHAACARRWMAAAACAALATAIKDPCFVLGPLVLAGALTDAPLGCSAAPDVGAQRGRGRGALRRAGGVLAVGLLVYLAAAGALTGFTVWREHIAYLFGGGVAGVDRIDHARPGEWLGLLWRCVQLLAGAIGWTGLLLGLLGLLRLRGLDRPGARLLIGAGLLTLLLFVLPVGFVYLRFLLVPLCVLLVGASLLVARLAVTAGSSLGRGRRRAQAALLGLVAAALLLDRGVADWHRHLCRGPDARREAADAAPALLPDGARVAVFADEREHGVPLDPQRWPQQVYGLVEAETRLGAWVASPDASAAAPDYLVWMSFPTDRTSGRPSEAVVSPRVGDKLGGIYHVAAVWGAPTGSHPERALAVRPMVTLLRRADIAAPAVPAGPVAPAAPARPASPAPSPSGGGR